MYSSNLTLPPPPSCCSFFLFPPFSSTLSCLFHAAQAHVSSLPYLNSFVSLRLYLYSPVLILKYPNQGSLGRADAEMRSGWVSNPEHTGSVKNRTPAAPRCPLPTSQQVLRDGMAQRGLPFPIPPNLQSPREGPFISDSFTLPDELGKKCWRIIQQNISSLMSNLINKNVKKRGLQLEMNYNNRTLHAFV